MKQPDKPLILLAGPRPSRAAAPARLILDTCQPGLVLRAVLGVEGLVGVGLLYADGNPWLWASRFAFVTAGALPATLLWLLLCCALKRPLARLPSAAQLAAGAGLGGGAGAMAVAILALFDSQAPAHWAASVCSGALVAWALLLALRWRARAMAPAATRARLAELQARIRPHFLFNTLNTAIALVRADPARAERVLEDLAELFHRALADDNERASLAEELALARGYLEIEQLRFGERLRLHWSLDQRAEAALLPVLILQPLVENAVRHGVEPSVAGADIWIKTQLRGRSQVQIEVRNTVPAGGSAAGQGLAQANVRERLQLLHDVEASFLARQRDGVYLARIQVPLRKQGSATP